MLFFPVIAVCIPHVSLPEASLSGRHKQWMTECVRPKAPENNIKKTGIIYGVDQGCEGSEMEDAFKFITCNHGITSKATYLTRAMMELATNQRRLPMQAAATMSLLPKNNEQTLQKAVANQPVSVSIDVGGYAFQFYLSRNFHRSLWN
ncbi:hypothetical protein V6N13_044449 [Hibiscus sabdariffa]|uniref:Peptidase C1A papain C-terminal domain-containing protein n=1 Tax=Hibiscus sabdariffa TaxID=183260 RepID=A0ABR2RID1_9ROSI